IAVGEFVAMRLVLAAGALWLIVVLTRANVRLSQVGWRPLLMGMLEPGVVTLLVSLGLTMTSPVNGSVFWSLTPLLMPVLGYLVLGERMEAAVIVAAVLAFAATMLLVWGQNQHGGGNWLGDLCGAPGVIAAAPNALMPRRPGQAGANPLVTSCWQLTTGCLFATLLISFLPSTGGGLAQASVAALSAL